MLNVLIISTGIYLSIGLIIGFFAILKMNRTSSWADFTKIHGMDTLRIQIGDPAFYAFGCLGILLLCCVTWPSQFVCKK